MSQAFEINIKLLSGYLGAGRQERNALLQNPDSVYQSHVRQLTTICPHWCPQALCVYGTLFKKKIGDKRIHRKYLTKKCVFKVCFLI